LVLPVASLLLEGRRVDEARLSEESRHLLEEMASGVLSLGDAVGAIGIAKHLEWFVEANQFVDQLLCGGVVAVVIAWGGGGGGGLWNKTEGR
jgi:hypothetical protein